MTRRFRFRWMPFSVTVLLVLLGLSLAHWQQDRAAQKQALQAKLVAGNHSAPLALGPQLLPPAEVEPLLYRRVRLTGQFVPAWSLYLDNRPNNGRAGFYVLTPFRLAGSQTHVLVARGWLPRDPLRRDHVPAYITPDGMETIEGLVKLNAGHVMQLGRAPPLAPAAIVQNVDVADLATASGLRFQPFVLEQTAQRQAENQGQGAASTGQTGQTDALVRDWPAPSLGADRNTGYAFQWYALTLMAILFYVYTGFRRGND